MTEKNTADIFNRFEQLFSQSLPDEYKTLAENVQKQAVFFNGFVKSATDKEDLASFWSLPETFGFGSIAENNNNSIKWPSNLFESSNSSSDGPSLENLASNFSKLVAQYQAEFMAFQQALIAINSIYQQINSAAFEKFKQQQQVSDESNPEKLCQLWLQAGEESFKEQAHQAPYIKAQQQLINTSTTLTNRHKEFSQQTSDLLGLPTQNDINKIHQDLHDLRLSFAEHRDKTEAEIIALKQQLNAKK